VLVPLLINHSGICDPDPNVRPIREEAAVCDPGSVIQLVGSKGSLSFRNSAVKDRRPGKLLTFVR